MDFQSPETSLKLCITCNTFYGSAASEWMCSSCYKSTHKEVTSAKTAALNTQKIEYPKIKSEQDEEKVNAEQKDRTRCFKCNKRLGLLGVECKCDYVFCNLHRLPQAHECRIDYKKIGQDKLIKDNKIVAASKITEI